MRLTTKLSRGLLVATVFALSSCTEANETLEIIDGLPLDVSEAEFKIAKSTARLFNDDRYSAMSNSYLYAPSAPTTYFGHPASGFGRGFESGRGCFAGVGIDGLESKQLDALRKRIGEVVGGDAPTQYSAVSDKYFTNRFSNAKVRVLISARRSEASKTGDVFAVSIGVSATNCDRRLAQGVWGTLTK